MFILLVFACVIFSFGKVVCDIFTVSEGWKRANLLEINFINYEKKFKTSIFRLYIFLDKNILDF